MSGELTDLGHQHIAALIDIMIAAGSQKIAIQIDDIALRDAGLAHVLRDAWTRLGGRLTVTAGSTGGAR